ncbi:MAG: hypothetical protein ACSLFR_12430 [Solirubrobacteraceae bacterium]
MQLTTRMLAAGGTVAGLGALAAIAMAAGGDPAAETQTITPVAASPQVRTEVVKTTVHVTKRERPKTTSARPAAPAVPAAPPSAQRAAVPATPAPAVVPVAQQVRSDDDDDAYDDHGGDDDRFEADDDHGDDDEGGEDD